MSLLHAILFRVHLVTLASLALSSCAAPKLPTYIEGALNEQDTLADLRITAQTSPKPDAIVGMWHRNADYRAGSDVHTARTSLLIRPDGTMIQKSRSGFNGGRNYSHTFDWKYQGHGKWRLGPNSGIQLSQGKLLYGAFGIFERVASDAMLSSP